MPTDYDSDSDSDDELDSEDYMQFVSMVQVMLASHRDWCPG